MSAQPNIKVFGLLNYLKYTPKIYFSANQRNCLKVPIPLQLLVKYQLVSDYLQSMNPHVKTIWSNAFRNGFCRTSLLYPA